MVPLVLEGQTLGKRHQHYNNLVNDAIKNNISFEAVKNQEEKSDIDKLFKIDLASKARNVDYILEILKSEDMLHISRAIKQSLWLITDDQYADIVNPKHLNDVLFPQMISKASCKFLLHVRLNLKDEKRVNEFFKYYEKKDSGIALKWLPFCSVACIEKAVEKHCDGLERGLYKRLCKKSFSVFETFNKYYNQRYYEKRAYIQSVMFLMQIDADKYLDALETVEDCSDSPNIPDFGPKYTELVMKKNPDRFLNRFDLYANNIHIATFVKYLGIDKIQDFLLKQVKNPELKSWFQYKNIKPYVKMMPKEGKFEFLKKNFIDKEVYDERGNEVQEDYPNSLQQSVMFRSAPCGGKERPTHISIYQWYRHAPFDIAFPELKKLIRTESSPEERIAMASVMLTCADANIHNIQAVLQYYHDTHINEPFKFKIQFINNVIHDTNTHKYEEKCWKILDELMHSSEVYIESNNNVDNCVEAIILYKVLHDEAIPEIIEKKFGTAHKVFPLKTRFNKLNEKEKEKIFKYLYAKLEEKLNKQIITNQEEFSKVVEILDKLINLFMAWKKELVDFPILLKKLKGISQLKKEKSYVTNTSPFYKKMKTSRKHIFEESLIWLPSEEVCINALKHDPELLKRYAREVDTLRYNDNVSLKYFLRKLRIYWAQTLGEDWAKLYRERLQHMGGHKAVIRALCTLLPLNDLWEIIKKYAPDYKKIKWSEADELQFSLQKNIAKNMHLARPQPPLEVIFLYAKGDHLQFALPSLNAVFYNMSCEQSRENIPKLIDAPVSIQKHVIRLAFTKLKMDEVKALFANIWKSTKNASIHAVIFELTHKLLCQQQSPAEVDDLWELLEMFIDNLFDDENKTIYALLGDLDPIPVRIKAKYLVKSYNFLKGLPAKADCEQFLNRLAPNIAGLMYSIDPDFVKNILLENNNKLFAKKEMIYEPNILYEVYAAYLICAESEEKQIKRFENIFLPVMKHCFGRWKEVSGRTFLVKVILMGQLDAIVERLPGFIFMKNVAAPVKLFKTIQNELENGLSVAENYIQITSWKLKSIFLQTAAGILHTIKYDKADSDETCTIGSNEEGELWKMLWEAVAPEFSNKCVQVLKEDVNTYSIWIYDIFGNAMGNMMDKMDFDILGTVRFTLCKALCADEDFIPGFLVALKLIPESTYNENQKSRMNEVRNIIRENPHLGVKMHYFQVYSMAEEMNFFLLNP